MEERQGNQQTLAILKKDDINEDEEDEEDPNIYENVNAKGKQLLHTDPVCPPENEYMNVGSRAQV